MKVTTWAMAAAAVAILGASSDVLAAQAAGKDGGFVSIRASDIKWADAPSIGPGAKIAVLEGDPKAAAPFTMRLKLPPGLKIGVHTHPVVERVTVLSGSFHFATGDKFDASKASVYRTGDGFVVPAGMPMYGFTNREESVVQLQSIGPWGIHYLDPADQPGKKR